MDALRAKPAVKPVDGEASASRPVVIPVDDGAAQHCSLALPAVNPVDDTAPSPRPVVTPVDDGAAPLAQPAVNPVDGAAPSSRPVVNPVDDEAAQPCSVPTASLPPAAIPVGGEAPLSASTVLCRAPLQGKATPDNRVPPFPWTVRRATLSPSSSPWTTGLCNVLARYHALSRAANVLQDPSRVLRPRRSC